MKRLLVIFASLVPCLLQAQYKDNPLSRLGLSESAAAMEEHVSFLSSMALEGRKAGSEGERMAAGYVAEKLSAAGVDVLSGTDGDLFGIKQENGDTLTSRNVIGFIPGYDRTLRDRYIVIGARLDNLGTMEYSVDGQQREKVFCGANGNASGLALLIQLAGMLNTNKVLLKRSVIIAAFGSSLEQGAGAWYFLNRSFAGASGIDAMVNLDMVGTPSRGFYAYTASNRDLDGVITALDGTLQPIKPKNVSMEPVNSDHRIFYDKEIPSVLFTTGMYPEYRTEKDLASILEYDMMERELEYVYNFTLSLVNGEKPAFRPTEDKNPGFLSGRDVVPYHECDWKPVFLGSNDPGVFMKKWVYVYLRYPKEAVRRGIQGRVLVDFTIDENGKVRDVAVRKGVDPLLDEEAVRVISASPDWKPARSRGKKVKCGMSLYVEFKLEKK